MVSSSNQPVEPACRRAAKTSNSRPDPVRPSSADPIRPAQSDNAPTPRKTPVLELKLNNVYNKVRDASLPQAVIWKIVGLASGIATTALAARTLGPEKIGASAVAVAIGTQLGVLTGSCLDTVLVRWAIDQDHRRKTEIAKIALVLRFGSLLGLAVPIGCFLHLALTLGSDPVLVTGTALILIAQALSLNWLFQAEHKINVLNKVAAAQSVLSLLVSAIVFRISNDRGIDILCLGVAQTAVAMWVIRYTRVTLGISVHIRSAVGYAKEALKLITESKWVLCSAVGVQLYLAADIFIIARILGSESSGHYRVALSLATGYQAILASISMMLYPRLVEWGKLNPDTFRSKQVASFLILAVTLVPLLLGAIVLTPSLVSLAFGPDYQASIPVAQLLLTAKTLLVMHGSFSLGLWATGQDKTLFIVVLATGCISLALNLSLIPHYGIKAAACVAIISESIVLVWTGLSKASRKYQKS